MNFNMTNRAYQRGAAKERRICKRKKMEGFEIAQRTAGSHSPFDVIAIEPKTKVIKLIQSKPPSLSETKRQQLEAEYSHLNGVYDVTFEVE